MTNKIDFTPADAGQLVSPLLIWITGYSGAGKTTVGRKVNFRLNESGVHSVFLDGDDLRGVLGSRWGYSKEDRVALAHSYFHLANLLMAQGVTVVISAVAMYSEVHSWIKKNVDRSLIAYLEVPTEERLARDRSTKNVYSQIGDISQLYDSPDFADLVIENSGSVTPDLAATEILRACYSGHAATGSDKGRNEHWNTYYSGGHLITEPSSFAQLVASQIAPAARLLEVGCGNGRDAFFFDSKECKVTAIDPSEAAINLCRAKPRAGRLNFIHGTANALSSSYDDIFDVVYSRFCLHAMTEAEEVETLRTANRVMLAGGLIFIECRSINDPLARKGEVISPTERIYGHYRRFIVLDELESRLEKTGFEVLWSQESDNLAAIEGDNPVVIRLAARKR